MSVADKKDQFFRWIRGRNFTYTYNEGLAKTSRLIVFFIVAILLMPTFTSIFTNVNDVNAATGVVRPNSDVTAQFANSTGASHYTEIDESTYSSTDFVSTGTGGAGGEIERYGMTSAAGSTINVTQIDVTVYSWISGGCQGTGGNCDTINVNISIDGATQTAQTFTLGTTANGNQTFTFTPGTSWTGDDDLEVILTRTVNGGGPGNSRDDNVIVAYVDATVTFDFAVDQSHYRWRDDSTALNTSGGFLAAEDTKPASTDTRVNDTLRLRMTFNTPGTAGSATQNFRLEWAVKGASCSASTGWTRVDTGSDAWEMTASSQYAHNDATSSALLTAPETTYVNGQGLETSDQSGNISLNFDEYTEVEWTIKANTNATEGETYCFRGTNAGNTLSSYNAYPEVTLFQTTATELTHEAYVWEYDDGTTADNNTLQTTPNTAITDVKKGERLTLRTHIKNTGSRNLRDNLGLFYDKNDGNWAKLDSGPPKSGNGSGCSSEANSDGWSCYVMSSLSTTATDSDIAIVNGSPWVSYYDSTNGTLGVARYVGSGGSGCQDSAWSCEVIDDPADVVGANNSIASSPSGDVWIAYQNVTDADIWVAQYTGSGTENTCGSGSANWDCRVIDTEVAQTYAEYTDTTFSYFNSTPSVFFSVNNDTQGRHAIYVGSGGTNCGNTDAWQCNAGFTGSDRTERHTEIIYEPSRSNPTSITYDDDTGQVYLKMVECSSDPCSAGTETVIDDTSADVGSFPSAALSPDEKLGISYYDAANNQLKYAFEESGSGCTATTFTCTTIVSAVDAGTGNDLAFSPSGDPWIAYVDSTNNELELARYVGSGGSGCDTSAWDCSVIDTAIDVGDQVEIAFDENGSAWITYYDETNSDVYIAQYSQYAEITSTPALAGNNGENLTSSRADSTDGGTGCVTGSATWNDGLLITAEEGRPTLPAGDLTSQCTEVSWVIDTSQAQEGETYRFVIASKDSFRSDKGVWRGPIAIGNYPTLTIESDTDLRVAKDTTPSFSVDCDVDANWGCEVVDYHASLGNIGDETSMAIGDDGTVWVSYEETNSGSLNVARYTGTGTESSCHDGTSEWECTVIDSSTGDIGSESSIAIGPDGKPWIAYHDAFSDNVKVARYVGDGNGTGCGITGSNDWSCEAIENINIASWMMSIVVGPSGKPMLAYVNMNSNFLRFAQYVGGGNGTGCGITTNWSCEVVDTDGFYLDMELDKNGTPWISYKSINNLVVAQYVGSGGSGCVGSSAWTCTTVDDTADTMGQSTSIAFSQDNVAYVSYSNETTDDLKVAINNGAGSGSGCGSGSLDWNCTVVDNQTYQVAERGTSIAFDVSGNAWIAYGENPNGTGGFHDNVKIARFVGGGNGTGCGSGSTDWTCQVTHNTGNEIGSYPSIAFDNSGAPWISYGGAFIPAFYVSKLHLPPGPLGSNDLIANDSSSARSGDAKYRLDGLGYSAISTEDASVDESDANPDQIPIYTAVKEFSSSSYDLGFKWVGQSTVSMATNNTTVQVYRYGSTNAWETLTTESSCAANIDCTITGATEGPKGEYYEDLGSGKYGTHFRIYQDAHTTNETLKTDFIEIYQIGPAMLTQEGYIFENDDGSTADTNTQQAVGNTPITVNKGERLNARFQVTHSGEQGANPNTEYALFYDRGGDNIWSMVQNAPPDTSTGNCTDTDWNCDVVDLNDDIGRVSSVAIDQTTGKVWVAYIDTTNRNLMVAQYVGSNGTGCDGGSTAWSCQIVQSSTVSLQDTISISIDSTGTPWIAYADDDGGSSSASLYVAYQQAGGGTCSNINWSCEAVQTSGDIRDTSIVIDSENIPHISYSDILESRELRYATRDGGGTCSNVNWSCESIEFSGISPPSTGEYNSIAVNLKNIPAISYYDDTNGSLSFAVRSGGGSGNCYNNNWSCETIDDIGSTNGVGRYTSLAYDSSGNPWFSYYDADNANLKLAQYVGTGGTGCTGATNSGAWTCSTLDSTGDVGSHTSLAFAADGSAWITYYDATNTQLKYITNSSGSWVASAIDNTGSDAVGEYSSLAFDDSGKAWTSYYDGGTEQDLKVANITGRQGEITFSPSSITNGSIVSESHADMTSTSDTSNRDDADCTTVGAGWNNGVTNSGQLLTGISLPIGSTTPQCTEVSFTIDTSQAQNGHTYRLVLASKDNWNPDKGVWRGPVDIQEYATIVVDEDTDWRFSKDSSTQFASDCFNTDWTCDVVDEETTETATAGLWSSLNFKNDDTPFITYRDVSSLDLRYAEYVGDGSGTGCGGNSNWICTTIDANNSAGAYTSNGVAPDGTIWIAYGYSTDRDIRVAYYVGSGGNCDDNFGGGSGSDAWQCETVHTDTLTGIEGGMVVDGSGIPWIVFRHDATGNEDTMVAHYVGSGGSCTNTAWECDNLDNDVTSNSSTPRIAVDHNNQVQVIKDNQNTTTGGGLEIAKYVGSGGSCADSAWDCENVWRISNSSVSLGNYYGFTFDQDGTGHFALSSEDGAVGSRLVHGLHTGTGTENSCGSDGSADWLCTDVIDWDIDGESTEMAIDANNNPWITFTRQASDDIYIARYVGSNGNCDTIGNSGSDAWQCDQIVDASFDDGSYTSPFASIAFDSNGDAWMSFYDRTSNYDLRIAKTKTPYTQLSTDDRSVNMDRNAKSGDLRYRLDDGRSPRSDKFGSCASNADSGGVCGLFDGEGSYDGLSVNPNERPMYAGAIGFETNAYVPQLSWEGRSTNADAPSTAGTDGDIVLQIYQFGTTNAWVDVASDTTSTDCNTVTCRVSGSPDGTPSDFYELINGKYWTYMRVYQYQDTASYIFRTDNFEATQPVQRLRGGSFFQGGIRKPLETIE